MMENILLGDNYLITGYEETDGKIDIFVKSKVKSCKCPKCSKKSSEYHATYTRHIQDTPIRNIGTWLHITAYEFECKNKECNVKTFTETLPFARKNKVMTDALIQFILGISIFMSSTATSLILSFLGVKVSADTIDNIIKKIKIVDNPDIEAIGIDDVAIRKGQTYATAIYDLNDHHLIALLDGRDGEAVKEWLKEHKKVKIVTRDRASSYAAAISEVLPDCIQVADRFHLFQNLVKYLKDIFYKEVPEKIFIKDNKIVDAADVKKIPSELNNVDERRLNEFKYDNSKPVDENGEEITFDNKKHNLNSIQYKKQEENRKKKYEMIKKLREKLKIASCHETKEIALEFGISPPTLRKYKSMSDEEVENIIIRNDYKKRKTIMDDYINIIYKMLKDNIPADYIMSYVLKMGYEGALSTLKDYISVIASNNNLPCVYENIYISYQYPDDVTIIKRYDLLKYILTLNEKTKKNEDIEKYFDLITDKYPIAKEIRDIFKDFHDTIFSGKEEKLDTFIEKYKDKIPGFCNGLKKDTAAVKHAISFTISSGFVEGNNNKFKLIKRIVYGKQKICNLFKKSYLCFLSTLDNFALEEIVNNVLDED